jgi:hypothetical protein
LLVIETSDRRKDYDVMTRLARWLIQAGLNPDRYDARIGAELRRRMKRMDAASGHGVEIKEVARGVEAPADAEKAAGAEAPAKCARREEIPGLYREVRQIEENAPLALPTGRSMITARRSSAPPRRAKRQPPPASAVVIDLLVYRRHAASPTSSA